ncbi:unknown protein [Microcystis aeruginosa NIES-843]|uniref:Uncharacterized protein n=1 Tax=Microcystis aeruginosa (strain NIES-843 / IAM M-2473) TaxID=449447 RepID=B0JKH2_MICAN|nr:unknown protein [Microcystis aeruginosa NIES-843]
MRFKAAPIPRVPKARIPRIEEGSGIELEAVGSWILSTISGQIAAPQPGVVMLIASNVISRNP